MSTNFNPEEYYVIRVDYSSEHIPMLAWGETSSRKFLKAEKITDMETPLKIEFDDPVPKKPLMNDILELGSSYAISEKLKQLLEKADLINLQYFPATILKTKKESITGYYILHCHNVIPAVDKNNYEGSAVEDGKIFEIKRFTLDADLLNKIPLHDRLFFRLAENRAYTIIHQSIVDEIKKAEITGILLYSVNNWLPKTEETKKDEIEQKPEINNESYSWDDDDDDFGDGDDTDEEMERIYELASENDEHIPEFIEAQREKGNRGFSQIEEITDVLSSTDNGLRLLAFCCVYGVDNQALEACIPEWVKQYVGKDIERQEKLFNYMLLEIAKTGKKQYSATFIAEALQAAGVKCDKNLLDKILDNINENELPLLSSISSK